MLRTTWGPLVILCALGLGCSDRAPARIAFDEPPSPVVHKRLLQLSASVVNKKGEPLGGSPVAYAAPPAGVVEVSSTGTLQCLKTGDATLTLSAAGLSQPVTVKCRIPTEISAPRELEFALGAAPVDLHARALGEGGSPLEGVPVEVTSADPSIVSVSAGKVRPVAVGKTRLRAAVDTIAAVVPVDVVEKIVSQPLSLRNGAKRDWTLQPGYYRVAVEVKADFQRKQGVTITWGGAGCDNQPEKQSHLVYCRVDQATTMTVANPAVLGLGATVTGSLKIDRFPAP